MDLNRLASKRTKRTRTWATVCAGLFGGTDSEDPEESR